ncbi:uncharacterized protein RAG0_02650 [Rhynchosporium agropyri]|uniref:Phospholipase/carboxylesterase/thioesterase domain-containing protein n=1 Tax=Rhynchosporium agropyri TaxID=914238 RepID=A0A1E1K205_9HELO|nr:uncharacterized protein RAG0_02650 [Rhynchosporium agropyri]
MAYKSYAIPPLSAHTHTVIFLHGYNTNASLSASDFSMKRASDGRFLCQIFPMIKWVFPESKFRYSTIFRKPVQQWFDIWSSQHPHQQQRLQREGLLESVQETLAVVRAEASIVPLRHIFLGGLDQGCATAIFSLLCSRVRLGGFFGYTGWLPFQSKVEGVKYKVDCQYMDIDADGIPAIIGGNHRLSLEDMCGSEYSKASMLLQRIFLAHSENDVNVPVENGRNVYRAMRSLEFPVTFKTYVNGHHHWIHEPQVVDDVVKYLNLEMIPDPC